MKKLVIALLSTNALLIALLMAQSAQARVKTYDAVKLAEYSACLQSIAVSEKGRLEFTVSSDPRLLCNKYKP